jgi:hypothetical protein
MSNKLIIKMPQNPYTLFQMRKREELKKANPQASGHDITKLISSEWKYMSDVDKEIYIYMAEEKKREFREAGGYELRREAKLRKKAAKMGRTRS